ncbi:MAG: ammonium transporter [Planctomycetaceae bacterium]|nr:ammonium transporter [Planctomycetaceae bacterium]
MQNAAGPVVAAEGSGADVITAEENDFKIDNLWIMLCGCLVFIMHLGFASLESGLTRQKNTINILFKNTMIISIGLLTYGLIGFNMMYPGFPEGVPKGAESEELGVIPEVLKLDAIPDFVTVAEKDVTAKLTYAYGDYTWYSDFFFQAMFAATCATIVSGAVAGRVKLGPFLVFSTCLLLFCYPVTGSWHWGYGWLESLGFYDFAGSTLVHSVGGWAALVMAWLIGPRIGKYNADNSSNAIPGSNMPLVAVGVFLLWFGWFGFNGGSVLSADPALTSLVLVTTSMAAAAGGLAAGLVSWVKGKPDVTMALNGILAGLVGVTASADSVTIQGAVIIGVVSGVLVYFSVIFVDKFIDDPVGAVSVHLVCGIWGTIAAALFGGHNLAVQLLGIAAIGGYTVIFSLIVGGIIHKTFGLRVDPEEEEVGLDVSEHGMKAYN